MCHPYARSFQMKKDVGAILQSIKPDTHFSAPGNVEEDQSLIVVLHGSNLGAKAPEVGTHSPPLIKNQKAP